MTSKKVCDVINVCNDLYIGDLQLLIQRLVEIVRAKAYTYGYQQHEAELRSCTTQSKIKKIKEYVDAIVSGNDEAK